MAYSPLLNSWPFAFFGDGKEGALHLYNSPPLGDGVDFFCHHWGMRAVNLMALVERLREHGFSPVPLGFADDQVPIYTVDAPEGTELWLYGTDLHVTP